MYIRNYINKIVTCVHLIYFERKFFFTSNQKLCDYAFSKFIEILSCTFIFEQI